VRPLWQALEKIPMAESKPVFVLYATLEEVTP